MSSTSIFIVEYAESTQNVCKCLSISIFLILVFMLTPLNNFIISSVFGKISILILLGYVLYYNIKQTNLFANKSNVQFSNGGWTPVKTNIACSYIFSIFIFILAFNVLRSFFRTTLIR